MEKDKGLLKRLLMLITYKKPRTVKQFYIPEGDGEKHGEENTRQIPDKEETHRKKEIKKPVPVDKKINQKSGNDAKADDKTISQDLTENLEYIKKKFNYPVNKDLVIREFAISGKYKAFLVFLDGMVDKTVINNSILRPLLQSKILNDEGQGCLLDEIMQSIIETNQTKKIAKPEEAVFEVLSGNTGLYVDGCDYYIFSETKGFDKRSVEKPQTEGVVMGSQEAFNENLRTNITLIRKIIKSNHLTTEFIKVGDVSNNQCAIMYLENIVNPAIIKEVKRRINGIKTDYIGSTGMLEQFIEDNPWSLLPTILSTERPDRTASHIVEGKVAILIDGTPLVMIVPVTVYSLLHSPEDAGLRWQHTTLLRMVRLLALFFATLLPGLYVAMTNFHREMIPTELLIAIAKAKENVPFPTIVEILLMEISFELIREAGIRIPGIIGNTLGIIGALILGQAAVQANIVSPVLIIVVAVTGLGNFALPNFNIAFGVRILRFLFIFAGGALGFYGITLSLVVIGALILDTKSFGVPFFTTTSPKTRKSYDLIVQWPVWRQEMRPDYVNARKERRQPEISKRWSRRDPETGYDRGGDNE